MRKVIALLLNLRSFRVEYPDGRTSGKMLYSVAKRYAEALSGKVIYAPERRDK